MDGYSASRTPRSRDIARLLGWWLGLYQPPDRHALRVIWDALVPDEPAVRVLFVGTRPYTRGLTRSRRRATVVTIDRDPRMRFFGAARHHAVALDRFDEVAEAPFDVAVVNGVLGAGIDTAEAAQLALTQVQRALRPGGALVLGINEERATTPDLALVPALAAFRPSAPPPFHRERLVLPSPFEGSHTFLFFERI